jgi:hypothetical protein
LAKVDSNSSIPPSPAPVPIPADTDYNNLDNKPKINDVELIGNKTLDELNIVKKEDGKGLSSNDFTDGKVQKLE